MSGSSVVQYCSDCLGRFGADADRCTECGAAARGLNYRQAQQRLLDLVAQEPSPDGRVRAIAAFGRRGEPDRAASLAEIAFKAPAGSPEGLAVVRCLEQLLCGTGRKEPFLRLADEHADPEVRMAARRALLRGR